MSLWSRHVVPFLVERACRSTTILAERRRWIPRARGRVLELGVGSGLNLAFYDAATVSNVTAIDPSPQLLARAAPRATAAPVPVELVETAAEQLPFDARSFDTVVVTYTLCSMGDPQAALREVRRVLRPDGDFIVVEHGLAPDASTQKWQHRITPVWRRLAGGCRLDRDVAALLRDASFEVGELEAAYSEGASWMSYTYQGVVR